MDWLKKLFGEKAGGGTIGDDRPQDPQGRDEDMQRKLEEGCAAKDAVYAQLGHLEPDVLALMVNPALRGGPRWPSFRQAWCVVRRPESTIVISDGLSDPFDTEGIPLGFKIEVFAEAPGTIENVAGSWLFRLVNQASQLVAGHGGLYDLIRELGCISTVLEVHGVPEAFQNDEGHVGVLLGVPADGFPSEIELPDGKIRLVSAKLLHRDELYFIERSENGEAARRTLVERFLSGPNGHVSDLTRASVV